MQNTKSYIIFSPEFYENTESQNQAAIEQLKETLRTNKIHYKEANGMYKGVKETSFIVGSEHETLVLELANKYNQHSVLYFQPNGDASLRILETNKVTPIGKLKAVDKETALNNHEGFTSFNGKYFIVV